MLRWFAALLLFLVPARADSVAALDAGRCAAMTEHGVLHPGAPVGCGRLALVRFSYVDFAGRDHDDGEIVVLDAVAPYVARIFAALHDNRFAIAKAQPMERYNGDDAAAMADDNTSGFNHRVVAGSSHLSLHAYGAAIDLNPGENPYLTRTGAAVTVAPPQGGDYLNRREDRPGKARRAGLDEEAVAIFADNGFLEWGGDWDNPIDYQHFDIGRSLAEKLAALPPLQAQDAFTATVDAYRRCVTENSDKSAAQRQLCVSRTRN
jgi:hypothetical protein